MDICCPYRSWKSLIGREYQTLIWNDGRPGVKGLGAAADRVGLRFPAPHDKAPAQYGWIKCWPDLHLADTGCALLYLNLD